LAHVRRAFWRRSQDDILASYAERYLDLLPKLHLRGRPVSMAVAGTLYPRTGAGVAFTDRAVAAARADGVSPAVTRTVIELTDLLTRRLKARGLMGA
jgi:aminopeptidase N